MPVNARNFSEALRMGVEVFHSLKKVLKSRGLSISVGDEGGFAPSLNTNEEALALIIESIDKAGLKAGSDIYLALDVAASELFEDGKYSFEGKKVNSDEMIAYYEELVGKYPVLSIEDGLSENDWKGWRSLTEKIGRKKSSARWR
jgi:enolase